MSLSLIQGYSSAEEEEEQEEPQYQKSSSDEENDDVIPQKNRYKPIFDPNPASSSSLPSALAAFSEVKFP